MVCAKSVLACGVEDTHTHTNTHTRGDKGAVRGGGVAITSDATAGAVLAGNLSAPFFLVFFLSFSFV